MTNPWSDPMRKLICMHQRLLAPDWVCHGCWRYERFSSALRPDGLLPWRLEHQRAPPHTEKGSHLGESKGRLKGDAPQLLWPRPPFLCGGFNPADSVVIPEIRPENRNSVEHLVQVFLFISPVSLTHPLVAPSAFLLDQNEPLKKNCQSVDLDSCVSFYMPTSPNHGDIKLSSVFRLNSLLDRADSVFFNKSEGIWGWHRMCVGTLRRPQRGILCPRGEDLIEFFTNSVRPAMAKLVFPNFLLGYKRKTRLILHLHGTATTGLWKLSA